MAARGCPGGSSQSPANPPLQEKGWVSRHPTPGPRPLCSGTSQVQSLCRPPPRSPRTPLRTGGVAGFLQVSRSPRPEAPVLRIGKPTFSGCPSVPPEPRTVGPWRAPSPRGTAQLLCQASDESRPPALCPLPAPEPRRKEPGGARGAFRPPGFPDVAAHRSHWGGRSPAGCSGQETGPSRPPRPGQAGLSAGQLEPNPGSRTPGSTTARPPLHWASTPSPRLPPQTPGHGLEARTSTHMHL